MGKNPFSGDRDLLAKFLARAGFSPAQARWLGEVLPTTKDIAQVAMVLVIAEKSGPDMQPFETSDADLAESANALLRTGLLTAWNHEQEVPQ